MLLSVPSLSSNNDDDDNDDDDDYVIRIKLLPCVILSLVALTTFGLNEISFKDQIS